MHGRQVQVFDQRRHILGKALDAVTLVRLVGAAVAAYIQRNDSVVTRQFGDLVFPVAGAGAQAMHQDQWRAVTVFLVVQLATVVIKK